jgi:hypothetical protein
MFAGRLQKESDKQTSGKSDWWIYEMLFSMICSARPNVTFRILSS